MFIKEFRKFIKVILSPLNSTLLFLSILIASFFCFYNLGQQNFSEGDQTIHSLVVQNMAHTGNLMNPTVVNKPYLNKPPLKMWIASFVIKIFGESNFNYRVLDGVLGVALVVAIYVLSYVLFQNPFLSFISIINLLGCKLFLFYHGTRIATQDTAMIFFYVLALFPLFYFIKNRQENFTELSADKPSDDKASKYFLMIGIFSGLGMLCKGLGALVIAPVGLATSILVPTPLKQLAKFYKSIIGLILCVFVPLLLVASLHGSNWYIFLRRLFFTEGIKRAVTGYHNVSNTWYYFDILFTRQLTVVPSLLLMGVLICFHQWTIRKRYQYGFVLIIGLVPILFYQIIKSKLPWYIFSSLPGLSIIAGISIVWLFNLAFSSGTKTFPVKFILCMLLIYGLFTMGDNVYANYKSITNMPAQYPLSTIAHEIEGRSKEPSIGIYKLRSFAKNDQLYLRMLNSNFAVTKNQIELEDFCQSTPNDLIISAFKHMPELTAICKPRGYLLMPIYRSRNKPAVALWYEKTGDIPNTMKPWCTKVNLASNNLLINSGWNETSATIHGVPFRGTRGTFSTIMIHGDGLMAYYPSLIKVNLASTAKGASNKENMIKISINDTEVVKIIAPKEGFNSYSGNIPSNTIQKGLNVLSIRHIEADGKSSTMTDKRELSFISEIEICPE